MRQPPHVPPYIIQIVLRLPAVCGEQQFCGQDIVAYAVVQILRYAVALALQSVDVALLLM